MSKNNSLTSIIESILFVAGDGVELNEIAEKLGVSVSEVKKAVEELKQKHTEEDGINVITYKNKAQLTSNPKFSEQIEAVLNPIKERALTKAALETVAIIAYQQPITRLEVEQVRGVSSDYAIQVLLNHNLIEVVGRKDAIGKPLLFGTTDEFLKKFEIESLEDLPKYEELLEQIQVIKSDKNSLYREYDVLSPDEAEKIENENKQEQNLNTQEEEKPLQEEKGEELENTDNEELNDIEEDEEDVDPIFKEEFDEEFNDEKEEYEKFLES